MIRSGKFEDNSGYACPLTAHSYRRWWFFGPWWTTYSRCHGSKCGVWKTFGSQGEGCCGLAGGLRPGQIINVK